MFLYPSAVDWKGLVRAVRKAKASVAATGGCIVVEGFLLFQCAELVAMADILVREQNKLFCKKIHLHGHDIECRSSI